MEKSCTVVSAYFNFKSKFDHSKYLEWITNFLGNINCNLVFYTNKECYETLKNIRQPFLDKTRFIVKEFDELHYSQEKYKEIWEYNNRIDTEKYHTKELYIIWNEKTKFVMNAIELNPFKSTHFLWVDAGCFRDKTLVPELKNFPNVNKFINNKITLLEIFNINTNEYNLKYPNMFGKKGLKLLSRIGGGIYGGDIEAWKIWNNKYDEILLRHFNDKLFAGKDQNIMFYIVQENNDLCNLIKPNTNRDKWFYLLEYFNLL